MPSYVNKKRQRVTTETAYLTNEVLARLNLKVAVGVHVRRLVFEKVGGSKRVVGVEFSESKEGPIYYASARKEILLWLVCLIIAEL